MTAPTRADAVAGEERDDALLRVRDLTVTFRSRGRRDVRAVDGVSYDLAPGSTTGIVGESGSGKSVSSLAALGLLPKRGVEVSGTVEYHGRDLLTLPDRELRDLRGSEIAMVFQDPMSSLDPRMRIRRIIAEPLVAQGIPRGDKVDDLLQRVGMNPDVAHRFPHQFSGGQRQRISVARALAPGPHILVADEPVSALDVSVRAQVLNLMDEVVEGFELTLVFVSHDLSVVRHVCDRIAVMRRGEIVEVAPTEQLFTDPQHPYTRQLLAAVPRLREALAGRSAAELAERTRAALAAEGAPVPDDEINPNADTTAPKLEDRR